MHNEWTKMKTLCDRVEGIEVFYSNYAFRRYNIQCHNGYDYVNIYQNQKPSVKELKQIQKRIKGN